MNPKKNDDEKWFEFFSFLVTSARGSLEEGVFTASLRLIDAAGRLPDLLPLETKSKDQFLLEMQALIEKGMTDEYLSSEDRYVAFLDSLLERLGTEVRRRNEL